MSQILCDMHSTLLIFLLATHFHLQLLLYAIHLHIVLLILIYKLFQILSSFYIVIVMFIVTLIKNTLAYPASTCHQTTCHQMSLF
jgi:hypothetical protein